ACYQYGRGVEQDITQAKQWYQKANEQGHRRANNALARLRREARLAKDPEPEDEDTDVEADTTDYWVIAPYSAEPLDEWQQVWDFDLANGVISIGWSKL